MVHGRAGLRLEAFKFGIYITVPLLASAMFNNPDIAQRFIDYYKFIEYPPEHPETTKMKEDIKNLKKNVEAHIRKKMLMERQLQQLHDSGSNGEKKKNNENLVDLIQPAGLDKASTLGDNALPNKSDAKEASSPTSRWWNVGRFFYRETPNARQRKD